MGQKVHPNGFRLGITRGWDSRWYSRKKEFGDLLFEDHGIRKMIKKEYTFAGIPKIEIERKGETVTVIVHCARPGILIGRKGAKIEKLTEDLQKLTGKIVDLKVSVITQSQGSIPLHTLRANIDYGFHEASTKAGRIGVKVWIFADEPTPVEGGR